MVSDHTLRLSRPLLYSLQSVQPVTSGTCSSKVRFLSLFHLPRFSTYVSLLFPQCSSSMRSMVLLPTSEVSPRTTLRSVSFSEETDLTSLSETIPTSRLSDPSKPLSRSIGAASESSIKYVQFLLCISLARANSSRSLARKCRNLPTPIRCYPSPSSNDRTPCRARRCPHRLPSNGRA